MEVVLPAPLTPDDERFCGSDVERPLQGLEQIKQRLLQRLADLRSVVKTAAFGAGTRVVEQMPGCANADVAGEQHRFEFFEQRLVDLAARAEYGSELIAQSGTGTGKPATQFGRPAAPAVLRGRFVLVTFEET